MYMSGICGLIVLRFLSLAYLFPLLCDKNDPVGLILIKRNTIELQWLEHLCIHEIMFETGVVRANEC